MWKQGGPAVLESESFVMIHYPTLKLEKFWGKYVEDYC
jgi:hypothetical protein